MKENRGINLEFLRKEISRRDFLKILIFSFILFVLSLLFLKRKEKNREFNFQEIKKIAKDISINIEFFDRETGNSDVKIILEIPFDHIYLYENLIDDLRGFMRRKSLIGRYFSGIIDRVEIREKDGKYEVVLRCNFYESLRDLHEVKGGIVSDKENWEEISQRILDRYEKNKPSRISLENFEKILDSIIEGIKNSVKEDYKDEAEFFFSQLNSKMLLAIILREILPNPSMDEKDLLYNFLIFKILLEAAGTQFIEGIPSLYDRLVSFGPFQITPFISSEVKEAYEIYLKSDKFQQEMMRIFNREIKFAFEITDLDNEMHYIWFILNVFKKFMGILLILKDDENKNKFKQLLTQDYNFLKFISLLHYYPSIALNLFYQSLNKGFESLDWESLKRSNKYNERFAYDYISDIESYYTLLLKS